MATKIDTLIVELALDPTKFTDGQKKAIAALKQLEQQSEKSGQNLQHHTQALEGLFSKLKFQALGFTAALFGANGIKDFVVNSNAAAAAMGRLSKTTNMSTQQISAWEGVVKQTGGSAGEASAAIQKMTDDLNLFDQGVATSTIPILNSMQISARDANNQVKSIGQIFFEINKAVHSGALSPGQARSKMLQLGFSDAMINSLLRGVTELQKLYDLQLKLNPVTKDQADKAAAAATAWNQAADAVSNFGAKLVAFANLPITEILNAITGIVSAAANAFDADALTKNFNKNTEKGFFHALLHGPSATRGSGGGGSPIPIGASAGVASPQVQGALDALQGTSGISRITAMNDLYHKHLGGQHPRGNAFDLTIDDPKQSAQMLQTILDTLAKSGIRAKGLNEYEHPSPNSSGKHLHITVLGGGAAAAARSRGGNVTNNQGGGVVIQSLVVNNPKDPESFAQGVDAALQRNMAGQMNWSN